MTASRRRILLLALAVLVVAGVYAVWVRWPEARGLVRLWGYAILTNTYISLLPFEPVFFYYANLHPPWVIALVSGFAVLITGIIDWETLNPLLHAGRVRKLYADTRIYRWSVKWFGRAPFWAVVVATMTPVPFYPIKFLALSSGFSEARYLSALMVGRLPRFYIYASVGHALHIPNWFLFLTFGVMLSVTVLAKVKQRLAPRRPSAEQGHTAPTAAGLYQVPGDDD